MRLLQGDFGAETVYDRDPVELIEKYVSSGAELIHIVDLDAAQTGRAGNRSLILKMAAASASPVQVGGGIRSAADAAELLDSGIHRVVLGSVAMKQPDVVIDLVNVHGAERICVALDVRPEGDEYRPVANGWLSAVPTSLKSLLDFYVKYGVEHVLITDVSRDGAMSGPNVELYRQIVADYPQILLQASGGVSSQADIDDLRRAGAAGAIVGRALLEGTVTLEGD